MSTINTLETNLSDMVGSVIQVGNNTIDTMKYLADACQIQVEKTSGIVKNEARKLAEHCEKQYENMLQEVRQTDKRLLWLDRKMISSPIQVAVEIKYLQKVVKENNMFHQMTEGFTSVQKEILATKIASENSPVKLKMINPIENFNSESSFISQLIDSGVKDFANEVLVNVHGLISEAADNVGFSKSKKDLKVTPEMFDTVFSDEKGRRLSTYCKLNNELNPILAIDLEGFDPLTKECELVMGRIEDYFQSKGLRVEFKSKKHYQPQGILRQRLIKNTKTQKDNRVLEKYLQTRIPNKKFLQSNKSKR